MLEYFIICVILFFLFLWYMGIFHKIYVDEETFRGGFYVYQNYQCHVNNYVKMKKTMINNLKKEGIDVSQLSFLTIVYDDPYNLFDPDTFRSSYGFLLKTYDSKLLETFKTKLNFEWTQLPECQALSGKFPYRFSSSISFGSLRFYPTCWGYILRNKKKLNDLLQREQKTGTIELFENGSINYYMPLSHFDSFYLTKHEQPLVVNDAKYTNLYYKKNK